MGKLIFLFGSKQLDKLKYLSFRIHCFNNYRNNNCPDLEVSYLIECQQSSDQNKAQIRRKERLRNLDRCRQALETGVTLEPPTTSRESSGRIIIIEFIYLLITIVGF